MANLIKKKPPSNLKNLGQLLRVATMDDMMCVYDVCV